MKHKPTKETIKSQCRYLKIDLPYRGEEDELYTYRSLFESPLEEGEVEYFPLVDFETQRWVATIDLREKRVIDWDSNFGAAKIDAKVCDEGVYTLLDSEMNEICHIAGYVPNGVVPPKDGWGDYLRMSIEADGSVAAIYDDLDFTEFAEEGIFPDDKPKEKKSKVNPNTMLIYTTAEVAKLKAGSEYDKFKERTQYELTPVVRHFLESFEQEQHKLKF
ncbi:MAG: hypothetical protein SNH28_03215 [Rikenellaceae bacterium]